MRAHPLTTSSGNWRSVKTSLAFCQHSGPAALASQAAPHRQRTTMRTRTILMPIGSTALAAAAIFGTTPGALAQAATTNGGGICNGVVNQLAHRGTVQENLLKAAAK